MRKECEAFKGVLLAVKGDDRIAKNLQDVSGKVHARLGDCGGYARQIADILLENRLPEKEL